MCVCVCVAKHETVRFRKTKVTQEKKGGASERERGMGNEEGDWGRGEGRTREDGYWGVRKGEVLVQPSRLTPVFCMMFAGRIISTADFVGHTTLFALATVIASGILQPGVAIYKLWTNMRN